MLADELLKKCLAELDRVQETFGAHRQRTNLIKQVREYLREYVDAYEPSTATPAVKAEDFKPLKGSAISFGEDLYIEDTLRLLYGAIDETESLGHKEYLRTAALLCEQDHEFSGLIRAAIILFSNQPRLYTRYISRNRLVHDRIVRNMNPGARYIYGLGA